MSIDLIPVPGFDGYAVTANGEVWSLKRGRFDRWKEPHRLAPYRDDDGYFHVTVHAPTKRRVAIHKLVSTAFLGERPAGLVTRHLDGDSSNNAASNLSYGTQQDNIADRGRHGRTAVGDRSGLAKVSDDQCREMLHRLKAGAKRADVAKAFGVSVPHTYALTSGKIRKHLNIGDIK